MYESFIETYSSRRVVIRKNYILELTPWYDTVPFCEFQCPESEK